MAGRGRGRGRGVAGEPRSACRWADDSDLVSDCKIFLDRLTAIYGTSGTGKTVLLRSILQRLRAVPEGTFFTGTEDSFPEIPKAFVHGKVTEEMLVGIWDRQGVKTDIYKRANNLAVLARLAARVPSPQIATMAGRVEAVRSQERAKLGEDSKAFEDVNEKCDELLRKAYKMHIEAHRRRIAAAALSKDEAHALRFLWFNPRHVVVFDDVTPQLKKLQKKEIVGEYFTRARHRFLTIIVCLHGDKYIDPENRKNAHVSIFTTSEEVELFFKRDCMGASASVRSAAAAIAADPRAFEKFHKILYLKDSAHPFVRFYMDKIARGALVFGSRSWRALGNSISSDGTNDPRNPFNVEFAAPV